ncbi:MAG: sulfotransferase, partial [Spongiibacteraceae bacterium]
APEAATFDTDPRIASAQAMYDAMLERVPELAAIHNFSSLLPQECNAIHTLHFASADFWAVYDVPDYLDWMTHGKQPGVMNTHKRVLQQLQWKGPKGRWILKSPPNLLLLDEVLETYPDACLVQTHREPARIVASLASMVRAIRRSYYGDEPALTDGKAIARSVLKYFGEALERATKRREDPVMDARFLDIAYRDIVNHPIETLQRIYARFDLPWTNVFETRLRKHITAGRDTGHGKHRYDMNEFGIAELKLDQQFPAYRARFGELLGD